MRRKSGKNGSGDSGHCAGSKRRLAFSLSALAFVSALGIVCINGLSVLAAPSFQEGMAEYNSGKYAHALGTFQTFKASYPNNALVHYYIALCQQGLGHIDQAKVEYKWVMESRDPSLATKAASGLAQLSNIRTTGSGRATSSASVIPTASAPGGSGSDKAPHGKVKTVIDFFTTR